MENVTFDGIKTACLVFLAFGGAIITVDKAVEACKRLFGKGRVDTEDRIKRVKDRIDDDEERLETVEDIVDRHGEDIASIKNDTRQMLIAVNVLLQHEITGNSIDRLKMAKDNLDQYLIGSK